LRNRLWLVGHGIDGDSFGEYHTLHRGSDIVVFEYVPAEVCPVCGDTLSDSQTIKRLEDLLDTESEPDKTAPVYQYV